jgi:hypothetical protein
LGEHKQQVLDNYPKVLELIKRQDIREKCHEASRFMEIHARTKQGSCSQRDYVRKYSTFLFMIKDEAKILKEFASGKITHPYYLFPKLRPIDDWILPDLSPYGVCDLALKTGDVPLRDFFRAVAFKMSGNDPSIVRGEAEYFSKYQLPREKQWVKTILKMYSYYPETRLVAPEYFED